MNIKRNIAQLDEAIAYSEREFLSVGNTLHAIEQEAVSIANESQRIIIELNKSQFDQYKHLIDQNSQKLSQEMAQSKPVSKTIIETLAAIGVLLKENQQELYRLIKLKKELITGSLQEKSQTVDKHLSTTLNESLNMSARIAVSLTNLTTCLDTMHLHSQLLVQNSHTSLNNLLNQHGKAHTLAFLLKDGSDDIRKNLDVMVQKLQTHDIVSQKIQQVIVQLDGLSEPLAQSSCPPDLIKHLEHTNEQFFEATETIRWQLLAVNSRITSLLHSCQELTTQNYDHISGYSRGLVARLQEMVQSVDDFTQLGAEMKPLITELRASIELMHGFTFDIDQFATDFSLIVPNKLVAQCQNISTQIETLFFLQTQNETLIEKQIERIASLNDLLQNLEEIHRQSVAHLVQIIPQLENLSIHLKELTDTFHTDQRITLAMSNCIDELRKAMPSSFSSSPSDALGSDQKPDHYEDFGDEFELF